MKVQSGRTQAERTAATRASLVAAGRELFARDGFAAVSTEAIVRTAGVTRGALYHQFADKAELFDAVCEVIEADVTARIVAALDDIADPLTAMERGAQEWLLACSEPEIHRVLLVDAPAVLGWLRWRQICQQYVLGMVEALLEAAIAARQVRDQPVRPLAHVLLAASDEAALYVAQASDADEARGEMLTVISTLVRALSA